MPGVIESLSKSFQPSINPRKTDVELTRLGPDDSPIDTFRFQYFPESLSDSRAVNWSPKDVPGGSLPIYQWINSGERTISFATTFSTDVDFSTDPLSYELKFKASGVERRNVDIRSAVTYLRSFMVPTYSGSSASEATGQLTQAPPKAILTLPGSGIGMFGGYNPAVADDAVVCVMTECSVEWQAFFPSGLPRLATVSLAFSQVPQFKGRVVFPTGEGMADVAQGEQLTSSAIPFLGYRFIEKKTPK